jgi:hypothetical protein
MRTLVFGGLAAMLLAGLAAAAARADDDDDAPAKPAGPRFGHTGRFGKPKPPEPKKPEASEAEVRAAAAAAQNQAAARREREFNAYLRRMDACDRLMDIAVATNNEEMQRQVEQLTERTWAVYQQNSGTFGATATDRAQLSLGDDAAGGPAIRGRQKP